MRRKGCPAGTFLRWPAMLLCCLLSLQILAATDQEWPALLQRSFDAARGEAQSALDAAPTPEARLAALLRLAEVHALYERPRELRETLAQGGPLLSAATVDQRLVFAMAAARLDAIEGRHAMALQRLQAALAEPLAGADPGRVLSARAATAQAMAIGGDYEAAAQEGARALDLATASGDAAARGRALEALAESAYLTQDYARALEYHRDAAAGFPPAAVQEAAAARMGVAQMTNVLGEREAALAMLPPLLALFRDTGNAVREADVLLLQGYFLSKLERFDEALAAHRSALALRERIGSPVDLANSHTHIAGVLRRLGRGDEAIAHARQAVALAESGDDASGQWDAYAALAQSLAERGEHREAYEYMHKSERALLARSRVDLLERTAALRERYAAERRELENRALNARLEAEGIAQRRLHAGIVIVSVLACALLVLALVLQRQVRRNRALARQDGLTGLLNRRAVLADAAPECLRARRYGYALSVLLFDVDEFKRINDEHGHGAGDVVLQRVAGICRRVVRAGDLCGRIGGEEFLLVLPHTDAEAAQVLAERLRVAIAGEVRSEDTRTVTVSIGVAQMNGHDGDTLETMVQRADAAMYAAKRAGRNRTVVAGDAAGLQSAPA